jgi:Tfp pilus assembly protein PilV
MHPMTETLPSRQRRLSTRGMTLVEAVAALSILCLLSIGILQVFLQTRRLTEGSVYQSTAQTIVSGYMEQLKNLPIKNITGNGNVGTSYPIKTSYDNQDFDNLTTSTGSPPALTAITPGVTPGGVVDNLRSFDMSTATSAISVVGTGAFTNGTSPSTWSVIWPNAANAYLTAIAPTILAPGASPVVAYTFQLNSTGPVYNAYDYATRTPDNNDLHLNLWLWVEDKSTATATPVYKITLIYTYQFTEGNKRRYQIGQLTTMRSRIDAYNAPAAGS